MIDCDAKFRWAPGPHQFTRQKKKNAWRNETLSWRIDSDMFVFGKFEVQISNTELENLGHLN